MSEPEDAPTGAEHDASTSADTAGIRHTLDYVRDAAKRQLKSARRGDDGVIAELRRWLPRIASAPSETIAESIKLADVQHAIARRLGYEHWAALKLALESRAPIHARAAQFLEAYREDRTSRALTILESTPELARYSIHTAVAVGDMDAIEMWLTLDPALANAPTMPDGTAPIIYASFCELKRARGISDDVSARIVARLLDSGANPNATKTLQENGGSIPVLYFPCVTNNVPVARVLLERGANPNDGESVYHAAQHDHRDILELLVAHGANLSGVVSAHGNTPLYFLATHRAANPITPKAMRGMAWLLEHGANPNIASNVRPSGKPTPSAGETPLQRAAASGLDASIMRLLVEHGAQVNAQRADGKTAYALAIRAGNTSAATYLASVGADTALSPTDRLLGACSSNDATTARALVAEHPTLIAELTTEDRSLLCEYVGEGRTESVKLMLELGWPLTDESEWGGTALHWAAWHGRASLVRALISAGAPLNVRDSTYGSSPIAWAAHGSHFAEDPPGADYVDVVYALVDAGASRAESFNRWGESPESMASAQVVAALRERGFVPG